MRNRAEKTEIGTAIIIAINAQISVPINIAAIPKCERFKSTWLASFMATFQALPVRK